MEFRDEKTRHYEATFVIRRIHMDERDRIASVPKPRVTVDFPMGLKDSNQFVRFADVISSVSRDKRFPLVIDSPVP